MTFVTARISPSGGLALMLAVALSGCGKIKPKDPDEAGQLRAEAKRQKAICASATAYDRLKSILFDQAVAQYGGDRANLDTLADYSTARMENPVVMGRDDALDITKCRGRFIVDVPPGAERGLSGEHSLQADIGYTAQASADGSGFVYQLTGAEPIVTKLAAFNLTSRAFRPLPAINEGLAETETLGSKAAAQAEVAQRLPSAAGQPTRVADASRAADLQRSGSTSPAPGRDARQVERAMAPPVGGESGEATVRAFYEGLRAGNGPAASAHVIPEKRSTGAFSAGAITRYYGQLREPLRVLDVVPMANGNYRVSYRYSAGRSRCNGSAVVSTTRRGGQELIRSIRALNGC